MTVYNFKAVFGYKVQDGLKRQTVRAPRKRPTRAGDTLQLYTGMRTRLCRKLLDTVCSSVLPVAIGPGWIELDGVPLEYVAIREFAWRDGFMNTDQLFGFFEKEYKLPISLEVIRWDVATVDAIVYGGIDVTYHLGEERLIGTRFVSDMVAAGMSLWRTPSGHVVSMLPWEWDAWWQAGVRVLPWYVFDGIPRAWERYEGPVAI